MTPEARYAAAIEVLDVWADGDAVDRALLRWSRGARYAGSRDRAAVRDHVFDILRNLGRCRALGGGDSGRALVLGWLRLTGADPAETFTGEGYAPPVLTEAENAGPAPAVPPSALADIPEWCLPFLTDTFGDKVDALAEAMSGRAPVFLRVNPRKGARDAAVSALARDGVTARPVATCATALEVCDGARRVRQAAAYLDGLVELQDLSVQQAVAAVPWPEGGRILDYCAGGGGKTLAIAGLVQGRFFAHDTAPERMTDIGPRAARAGVEVTRIAPGEVTGEGPFDAVLCDVPCSGSGTWRRDPEARWRLSPDRLDALGGLQDQILDDASVHVGPGGCLVYMTCSVFTVENGGRVQAFLDRAPGWRLGSSLAFSPLDGSDGFYVAILSRSDVSA